MLAKILAVKALSLENLMLHDLPILDASADHRLRGYIDDALIPYSQAFENIIQIIENAM